MEKLKPLKEILRQDERNRYFVKMFTGQPFTREEHYARIAFYQLNNTVPEDVRSYFATIQNVCVYAWFSYDLYAVVQFLCFTLIEMALAKRLPMPGADKRSLGNLLDEAVRRKLINLKKFTHIRHARQAGAEQIRVERQIVKRDRSVAPPKTNTSAIMMNGIRRMRNALAHPRSEALIMPHEALFALQFTTEFINQLFASTVSPRSVP